MTIFEDALLKERIKNLPKIYKPFKKVKSNIPILKTKYIYYVWIGDDRYTDRTYEMTGELKSQFSTRIVYYHLIEKREDFELFIYDNFRKITEIHFNCYGGLQATTYLKNGLYHNKNSSAFSILSDFEEEYYFINGKELTDIEFKQMIREKKLNRIIKPLD